MGIVAGRASGLLVNDVETVPAVLAQAVGGPETLIAEDALAAVTLVAKRIAAGILGTLIGDQKLSFKDWRESRTVRTVGAGAAGF